MSDSRQAHDTQKLPDDSSLPRVTPAAGEQTPTGWSRRTAIAAGLGAGAGVVAGAGSAYAYASSQSPEYTPNLSTATVGFYGDKQAGIDTPPPAYGQFIAFDLAENTTKDAVARLLRILTQDATQLTAGQAPIVDQEPELAAVPANLTVTVGFGERIFDIVAPEKKPDWLKPLPAFKQIDRLDDAWNDGDLLLQLCADDRVTLAHAQRALLKGLRSFGSIRWVQEGFRRSYGSENPGETTRNLFGQIDGTINPTTADDTMNQYVWGQNLEGVQAWEPGGTSLVIRRIHMNMDTWDLSDRPAREDAVGRKLSNGAPLTGTNEHDVADLGATNELGLTVIAPYAHIRRAAPEKEVERILRRPYNYDLPVSHASGISQHGDITGGISQTGLIFCSYQADPIQQFVPIQQRLAELDMLNTWTTPIGSAVFAIPAGCREDQFIGQALFS